MVAESVEEDLDLSLQLLVIQGKVHVRTVLVIVIVVWDTI